MRRWALELAVLAAAMLVFALIGPFGSFARPMAARLLQWSLAVAGGYVFFRPVIAAGRALAAQSRVPVAGAIAAACLFATIPTTMVVALAWSGFRWRTITIADLAGLYPPVLVIGALLTVLQLLVRRAVRGGAPAPSPAAQAASADCVAAPAPAPGGAAFLDRLPPHLGETLLCLENEDHYVRAHSAAGSALILMRMRDAVAELKGVEGARVHRSWWVARAAVAEVVRRDRNLRLRLVDGREVPVARSSVAMLRERGWLARQSGEGA